MRTLGKLAVAIATAGVLLVICLLAASVYSYHVLTDETVIAEITFSPAGEQRYVAYLRTGDRCHQRAFRLLGDQWRIDAEFLKWKYWASFLGLVSQYRLERLEGRYADTEEQNERPTQAYDIAEATVIDLASFARALGPLNFLVDATYGSSTYEDIDTEKTFYVYQSPTGIFTRSRVPPRRAVTADGLPIEITRTCDAPPGYWQRFMAWVDSRVRRLGGSAPAADLSNAES
jgi:hypothetical protein